VLRRGGCSGERGGTAAAVMEMARWRGGAVAFWFAEVVCEEEELAL